MSTLRVALNKSEEWRDDHEAQANIKRHTVILYGKHGLQRCGL